MDRDQYLLLYEKFLAGNATPEEVDLIMLYRDKFEIPELHPEESREEYKKIEDRILKKLDASIGHKKGRVISTWWMAAAAMLLVTAGAFFYKIREKHDTHKLYLGNINKQNTINPGSNKALLILANGKKIVLNDVTAGTIVKQGNVVVRKQKNGILQYAVLADINRTANNNQPVEYNTISTPRGGQYQVILPDGSKVWLNSASSLKYPTSFTGDERKVELTGEGYFEVAKNKKMPFKVKFRGEEAEDLGTHFDIMAYNDEDETRTSLLEGSVRVSKGNFSRILVPGEQTVSPDDQSGFIVKNADMVSVLAWKNGVFMLQNSNIRQIMRQIARWYNVDVIYQGNLQDKIYGGSVSKSQDITEILKDLELTGTIHFKVEGRRVTVME